jgi:hypothetical protein
VFFVPLCGRCSESVNSASTASILSGPSGPSAKRKTFRGTAPSRLFFKDEACATRTSLLRAFSRRTFLTCIAFRAMVPLRLFFEETSFFRAFSRRAFLTCAVKGLV